jgi:hypothetical protein
MYLASSEGKVVSFDDHLHHVCWQDFEIRSSGVLQASEINVPEPDVKHPKSKASPRVEPPVKGDDDHEAQNNEQVESVENLPRQPPKRLVKRQHQNAHQRDGNDPCRPLINHEVVRVAWSVDVAVPKSDENAPNGKVPATRANIINK